LEIVGQTNQKQHPDRIGHKSAMMIDRLPVISAGSAMDFSPDSRGDSSYRLDKRPIIAAGADYAAPATILKRNSKRTAK